MPLSRLAQLLQRSVVRGKIVKVNYFEEQGLWVFLEKLKAQGWLELFTKDFLRADRVGLGVGSAGAVPELTAEVLREPCSPGMISGSLIGDSSGEETISSITGGHCLEDPLFLHGFWVL